MAELLPAPSLLPPAAPRQSAAFTEEDLIRHGGDFAASLPYANATPDPGNPVALTPDWSPGPGGLSGLAYCIFEFSIDGYDRDPELNYGFSAPPASPGHCYIALAHWPTDTWRWFLGNTAGRVQPGNLTPYIAPGGRLLAVVALIGDTPASLDYVCVGAPTVEAVLTLSPATGYAPFTATARASQSDTAVGTIELYEWDWDGDGAYDEQTAESSAEHQFTSAGEHEVGLRVTSSYGVQDSTTASLTANDGWAHSWGGDLAEQCRAIAYDADAGRVFLAGDGESFDHGNDDVHQLCFDLAGNLLWARGWGGADSELVRDIDVASDGSLYLAGYSRSYGAGSHDVLLQKWNPDGSLAWSRTWGTADSDYGLSVDAYTDAVYVAGQTLGYPAAGHEMLVLKYDGDGELAWARTLGGPNSESARAVTVRRPSLLDDPVIYVCGNSASFDGGPTALAYATLTPEGALTTFATMELPGYDVQGVDIATTRHVAGYDVLLCADALGGLWVRHPFFVEYGGTQTAKVWNDNIAGYASSIATIDGALYLTGQYDNRDDPARGFVARFGLDLALEGLEHWGPADSYSSIHDLAVISGGGGLLVAAGAERSAGAQWQQLAGQFDSVTVDWIVRAAGSASRNGTSGAPSAAAYPLEDGLLDSGGGGNDMAAIARPLL